MRNRDSSTSTGNRAFDFATILSVALALLLLVAATACDDSDSPTAPEGPGDGFTIAFEQDFETQRHNWITDDMEGIEGWCGDIRRVTATSPVAASQGSGYALAEHGGCNAFWTENGFQSSGPYAPFGEYSSSHPQGGFVYELDIYLDPTWTPGPEGSIFTYAVSIILLDQGYPDGLRYLVAPVTKAGNALLVSGTPVSEAGWYTFRHMIGEQGGSLDVEFTLVRDGRVVFTRPATSTAFSEEAFTSFDVSNVGTGYAWFIAIRDGLAVPIDNQKRYHAR